MTISYKKLIPVIGALLGFCAVSSGAPMVTANRTRGVAPLAVFFDATAETSGVAQPPLVDGYRQFAAFHYEWFFGDNPSAVWSTTGKPKHLAFGYVAGHVFETPGTYQVVLRVTEPTGAVHIYEQQIIVDDPEIIYANSSLNASERTVYVSLLGNDNNVGSFNAPLRTFSRGKSRLFASNGPRRLLLKRGETFTDSGGSTISGRTGPFTIGAYGSGAKPIIVSGGSQPVLSLAETTTDVRVVDVDFLGAGFGYAMIPGTRTLLLRSHVSNFSSGISTSELYGNKAGTFFVENTFDLHVDYDIYYNFGEKVAILGNSLNDVNGEHLIRSYITHSVIGHNRFRGGHNGKLQLKFVGYFPTGHPDRAPGTPSEQVEFSIISDNIFENPDPCSWMITLGPVDGGKDQRLEQVIFERNLLKAGLITGTMLYGNNAHVTVRNNIFDATGGSPSVTAVRVTRRGVEPDPLGYAIYNNTMYRSGVGDLTPIQIDSMASESCVRNNLVTGISVPVITGGGSDLCEEGNMVLAQSVLMNPALGDYSVRAGSANIDAGVNSYSVPTDIDGFPRPVNGGRGSLWDVGAVEYRSESVALNRAPVVSAGGSMEVFLPGGVVTLDATVLDDGRPGPPFNLTSNWQQISGPGPVEIADPHQTDALATFIEPGTYTLRLTASDGILAASDDLTVSVIDATPVVSKVGMNVAKVYGWTSQIPFVDVFRQSRPWISNTLGGSSTDTRIVIPSDANGYPLEIPYNNGTDPPQIVRTTMVDVGAGAYPTGQYTLTFTGDGEIELMGDGSGRFNQTGGTGTYAFQVNSSVYGIRLKLLRSSAANRVRDIHVIMPGYETSYQTRPFFPPFLERMRGFGAIRFMEWIRTNGQDQLVAWSDRPTTDHYTQAGSKGASYEYAIQLAEEVDADPWLTIPHAADDGFITQLARLVRDQMEIGRKVYIEYSNEVWNGIFDQTSYARSRGVALGLSTDSVIAGRRYYAKRSAEIFKIFETEFGGQSNRIVKVLSGQAGSTSVASDVIAAFQQTQINNVPVNPTGVRFDALAIAPYFGNGLADEIVTAGETATITVSEILDRAEFDYLPQAVSRMQAHKALADSYKVPMIAYEGGQHIVATGNNVNNSALTDKLQAANRDPRMKEIYKKYHAAWVASGGGVITYFNFAQVPNQYGSWGVLEYVEQPESEAPKYAALRELISAGN